MTECPTCGGPVVVTRDPTPRSVGDFVGTVTYEPDTTEVERLRALLLDISVGYDLTPKLADRVREALGEG